MLFLPNEAAQWRAANGQPYATRTQSARPLPQPGYFSFLAF